jgi:hypothetical protein
MNLAFLITSYLYICVSNNFDARNVVYINVNMFVKSCNVFIHL